MKPNTRWTWAAVLVVAAAAGAWRWNLRAGATAPDTAPPEPVAQISSEAVRERVLADTLDAFGEVSPGQLAGLGFPRAGQVTRLTVLPGDRVSHGAVLATLDVDPATREAYAQATNALTLARREADRLRQLLALQLATRSQVDAADKAVLDAEGAVKALDAQGGGATTAAIKAPFDGVVASVAVAQGDRVQPGAAILQLARADTLRVQIGIEPAQSKRVRAGTMAELLPIYTTADKPVPIEAQVTSVQDIVDPKTQLVNAIVNLPRDVGASLVPGMRVRASLKVGSRTAVAVPRNAVLSDGRGDYVYQVQEGKARRVGVTKQFESGGYVAIAGLTDLKLPVVTVGNYELQDGMAVREAAR